MRIQMKELLKHKPLQSLTFGKAKTAGRNSSGRITVFHRGGGAKRLQRKIDLKRATTSTGVVERIEYDPNRSSRIALVRWIDGVVQNNNAHRSVSVPDGAFEAKSQMKASVRDYFSLSAMSASVGTGKDGIFGGVGVGLPRIAVAGAKSDFFAVRSGDVDRDETVSLSEIQKSRVGSDVWERRIRRSAALSWHCLGQHKENSGLKGLVQSELKAKVDQGSLLPSQLISYGLRSGRSSYLDVGKGLSNAVIPVDAGSKVDCVPVSYVLATHQLEAGKMVMNCDWSKPSKGGFSRPADGADSLLQFRDLVRSPSKGLEEGGSKLPASRQRPTTDDYDILDLNSKVGNCIPLADVRMGTWVHNIEYRPGQGGKLVRAAGTYAKVVKHQNSQCLLRLPSGAEKFIDSRCRATIGMVSNPSHGAKKLRKAGHSRWLGIRPTVRGVAMNPVDHPHGGGEGRTKGGRPSVSPWGKPTKSGFRTGVGKRKT